MSNLKYRIALIVALLAASIWALFPRTVTERVRQKDGTLVEKQVTRVPLKRGLDLQGGMHLALEVDESKGTVANKSEALNNALRVVRNRIDEFGVSEPVVQKVGEDRIIVELPGIDDPERATQVVQKSAFLQFQITDKSQALDRALPRIDAIARDKGLAVAAAAAGAPKRDSAAQKAVTSLFAGSADSAKADSAKAKVASADSSAKDTGAAALTGSRDGALSRILQPFQVPGQYLVAAGDEPVAKRILTDSTVLGALPPGKVVRWGSDSVVAGGKLYRTLFVLDSRPIITGDYLQDAKPRTDPIEGTVVSFSLNNEGGRRFKTETAKHIGDYMAIVLDDRVMSAPVIQSSIGREGQITMGRSGDVQEAQDLALVLRAGALPVPLKVAEARQIGASLGQDSVSKGITAGLIAIALIVTILVGYYRFSGVLAVVALVLYMVYTMAVLAGFDAVLTLPGIAGLVLSVGIAVDANVLIFERIREELDRGKTVRTSIDEGFRHALSAIVDTSVTTILTAAILYQYGTGPVRGFAVTLIAGIVASLFTAIFVVRTFYMMWLSRARADQALSI
ncbi:MAG: protein translocase subunit SecD [Gemmatimonadaceae bacterium]